VVVLPIHDAIAVKSSDSDWGVEALRTAWIDFFNTDYCDVKVEQY